MNLKSFFNQHPSGAIAYSGGVKSSLLIWAASVYGENWHAYFVKTAFQPASELLDAKKIAKQCGIPLTIIESDLSIYPAIATNSTHRCSLCKDMLLHMIYYQALADGYTFLIDGSTDFPSRQSCPSIRTSALQIHSPLIEVQLTRGNIQTLARQANMFIWNKSPYNCLATRISNGTPINNETLKKIEIGESFLCSIGLRSPLLQFSPLQIVIIISNDQLSYTLDRQHHLLKIFSSLFPNTSIAVQANSLSEPILLPKI